MAGLCNDICLENSQPGATGWFEPAMRPRPTADTGGAWVDTYQTVRGYADKDSLNRGESVGLHVSTTQSSYDLEIYRVGYYGGAGARLITAVRGLPGANRPVPALDANGSAICNWPVSYTLQTGADWAPGVYLAKAITGGATGNIIFIVRDDGVPHDIVMEIPVATYQAYNNWGGKSLYDFSSSNGQHANKVSYDRPYQEGAGAGELFAGNYNMIRFLEANGYDVTYVTSVDLEYRPGVLAGRKIFLSDHHSEYWSTPMRNNVTAARDAGLHLAWFGANNMFWQIRFDSPRLQTCYKSVSDPVADRSLTTINWRDPPVNRPENALFGVMFEWFINYDQTVPWTAANTSHWLYSGTGLHDGDQIPGLVGDEWDRVFDNGSTPPGLVTLSNSHFPYSDANGNTQTATQNASVYTAQSGALVFAASTVDWSWKIDDNDALAMGADSRVQQMTRNVLNKMLATPTGTGGGSPDAGPPDSGPPDAGPPDAGPADAGSPPPPPPAPGAQLFFDNFNRTNNSGLASTWKVVSGLWREDGTKAQSDLDGTDEAQVVGLSCADCSLQARVDGFAAGTLALELRRQASGDRYELALLASGHVQLRRHNGSATTVLADAASGIPDLGDWSTLLLSVSGANPVQLSGSVNGAVKVSFADSSSSAITAAGGAGMGATLAGLWFDDYTVTALGGGSGGGGGGSDAGTPDAGPADAGSPDAGPADAGSHDAGPADAGSPDAGPADAGSPDAGPADAGSPDAGPPPPPPPPPPTGTIFSDNFNRSSPDNLGSGWTIAQGRFITDTRANSDLDGLDRAIVTGVTCGDCRIDSRLVAFADGEAMLELRGSGTTRYALALTTSGKLELRRYKSGVATVLASAASGIADLTDWASVSFSVSGTAPVVLKGYVAGVQKVTFSDSSTSALLTPGAAGIAATISGIWFDDFVLSH